MSKKLIENCIILIVLNVLREIMLYFIYVIVLFVPPKKSLNVFFPSKLYISECRRLELYAILNVYDILIKANAFYIFYLKVYFLMHFFILIAKKVFNLRSGNTQDHLEIMTPTQL